MSEWKMDMLIKLGNKDVWVFDVSASGLTDGAGYDSVMLWHGLTDESETIGLSNWAACITPVDLL